MFGNTRLLAPEVQKLNLSHPGFKPKTCPLQEQAANRLSQLVGLPLLLLRILVRSKFKMAFIYLQTNISDV